MPELVVAARPLLEVADVIRSHGEAFLQKYGGTVPAIAKKVLRDLARCHQEGQVLFLRAANASRIVSEVGRVVAWKL